jgi:hypothetical protein
MSRRLATSVLALLALTVTFAACGPEEEDASIKVVNHWDRVVVFSLDNSEVGRLQPLTNREEHVDKGTYRLTLRLEDGSLLFEQTFFIDSGQYVQYHVQSDGTVLAYAGDDDPET